MSKRATFKLGKRPCRMGVSYNGRSQKHGEERVPAGDFQIDGVILERDELISIFGDEGIIAAWFAAGGMGALVPQAWTRRAGGEFSCPMKFIDCSVSLYLGMDGEATLKLTDCKVAKPTFRLLEGAANAGIVLMSVQIQATRRGGLDANVIQDYAGEEIHASFGFGKVEEKTTRQQELQLAAKEGGSAAEESAPMH